jgi:hypothetical protein
MTPSIGIMVAGYVMFRCIEILCRPTTFFASRGQHILVCIVGSIGIAVTAFIALDLILT